MQAEEMRLDGNAAAGMLRELFAQDVTSAAVICRGCGKTGPVAALLEYGHAMGIVLRCPACEGVMLRLVRTPRSVCLDASGIALLSIPSDALVC
jgi:hypothetical protein